MSTILRTSNRVALALAVLCSVLSWAPHSLAQTPGLVAAYSFNEGTGSTVSDLSGNKLTGTIVGAIWSNQGRFGNALSFNGTASYVDLGDPAALQLTGSMTVEAWVKASADPYDDGQIVAKSDDLSGWQLKTSPDTGPHTFGVAVSGSVGSHTQRYSTITRSLNTWYHLAGVYNADARTLEIYVNGVLNNGILRETVPASSVNAAVNVNIGRRTGGYYFNGMIDEVRIYNRVLSPAELQSDMNTPVGGTVPPADSQVPSAPADLSASSNGSAINLNWTASTDNVAVTGYLVDRCQGIGCSNFTQITALTGISYNDATVSAGNTYSYSVRATDAALNLSSYSNVASVNTPVASSISAAAYSFNEGSGTSVNDLSGNGTTGLLQGTSWTASGKYGNALTFNGSSGYVNLGIPAVLQSTGSMTWSAWVKASATPWNDGQIISKSADGGGWQLKTSPDMGPQNFAVKVTGSSGSAYRYSNTIRALNTWYYVAGVYNATTRSLNIYVNGALDNGVLRGAVPSAQVLQNVNVNIGRRSNGYYFNGVIDEVRIYNRALSQAEIQSDMNTPVGLSTQFADTQRPSPPGSLAATAPGEAQINLTWTAATDNVAVTGYQLERCQGSGCANFVQIATTTGTSYGNLGLSAGTSYSYRVRATDRAGNLGSYTNAASATTSVADTQAPTEPSNLTANAVSANQVNLRWTASSDNVGVAGYTIYQNSMPVGTATSSPYTDTGLIPNTTYTYTTSAFDATGNTSLLSQSVSATTPSGPSAPVYPLKVAASGRYLVDQNNVPFLMFGDAPHSMVVNLSVADTTAYMTNRASHEINALWVELLCNNYTGNYNVNGQNGATFDGITPFTNASDISTPNNAYFSRVDQMVNIAAGKGITILLDTFETGGWMPFLRSQGNTKAFNWGVYLGNRYKNFPNIVWITGNDFQTWNTSSTDNELIKNIMAGIASVDPNHLQTIQLNYDISGSLDDALTAPYVTLAGAYTYMPTYDEVLAQYNKTSSIPVMLQEAHYELEAVGGCCGESGTPNILRRQAYWSALSGALAGQMYGNRYTVSFESGWQSNMDTAGISQMNHWKTFFTSIPWYNLVPDQTHAVVTSGYGTYEGSYALFDNTYVTTARTPDGRFVVAYAPTSQTLTVDMTTLSGPATARWFDPASGAYTSIFGSPFANTGTRNFATPGNNSAGSLDWVLLLAVR